MKTVFIDRKQTELEVEGGHLLVRNTGLRTNFSVPLNVLEFLVISASTTFSSTLLGRLSQEGITTVFLNPRQPDASTMTHGLLHNNAERRLFQYQAIANDGWKLIYSKALVRDKLRAQRAMLIKALRQRPDCRYKLTNGMKRLGGMLEKVDIMTNIDSLRGIEGAAGTAYFEAYQSLFPPSLEFHGRNRRPPRDPVNVVLSLSFTLLHAEAVRVLFATGFDPLLGIYHCPSFGRESLACDLVECFRPLVEHWVWRSFAAETLRRDHFTMGAGDSDIPCMLGKAGRAIYYAHYEAMAKCWRRLMRRAARNWLARLQADYTFNSNAMLTTNDSGNAASLSISTEAP